MKGYFSVLLAGIFLGLIGPIVKLIGDSIPIMTASFFRMLIGMLFLLAIVPLMDKTAFRVGWKDLKHYILIGLLIAIDFSLYMMAYTLAPVSNVVLLTYTFPFLLAIISHFVLRERVTKLMLITFAIAFIGILVINPFQLGYLTGSLFALANALLYAIIYAYMRCIDKRHHIGVVFWFILFAAIFLSPAPFIYGLGSVSWNYLWVIVLGVFSTGMAYLFLNLGLERISAESVSLIVMTTEPVVAIALSILFTGEILTVNVFTGGILILAAGTILEKRHGVTRR